MSSLFAVIDLLISEAICTGTLGTLAVLRIASSFMEPSISLADLGGFQIPEVMLTYKYHQWLSEFVTQYWFSVYHSSRSLTAILLFTFLDLFQSTLLKLLRGIDRRRFCSCHNFGRSIYFDFPDD